jgi:hypothetical protein
MSGFFSPAWHKEVPKSDSGWRISTRQIMPSWPAILQIPSPFREKLMPKDTLQGTTGFKIQGQTEERAHPAMTASLFSTRSE